MLLQFTVENFLSFRDETRLSMKAPPGVTEQTIEVPGHPGLRVMRITALYGANASGKSNLVGAIQVATDLIAGAPRLPHGPFLLDEDAAARPSRFQFDFILEGRLYTYGFEVDTSQIVSEWLFEGEELIFSREAGDSEPRIELGDRLRQGDGDYQQRIRFVAEGVPNRRLLLLEMAERHVHEVQPLQAWLSKGVVTVAPETRYRGLYRNLALNPELRRFYSESLRAMDTGILEVRVVSSEQRPESRPEGAVEPSEENGKRVWRMLEFFHEGNVGQPLLEENESDGTRRLLHLLPLLYARPQVSLDTFVIDELDRSLHTSLTRRFIQDFLDQDRRGPGNQLLFTTHDTNLLNGRLLVPAAIWFVEKDRTGASHLHSLAEYDSGQLTRLTERLEEGYLQGRFGAIPFLAPRDLAWAPAHHEEGKTP
jgi:AAA15 family ATPase/GTPase